MADTIFKIPKLKGSSNYEIWAIKIEAILIKEGFFRFLSNRNLELNEEAIKATSLIRLSLEDGPLLQTKNITNPYELWESLKNLYMAKGFSSNFILCKELINTTLTKSKDIESYIYNFKKLINNLASKLID